MSAPHLFADSVAGDRIVIEGEDAHHAVRVLRLRPGERVTVSDGAGAVAEGVVADAGKTLIVDVTARRTVAPQAPRLTVVQGIPKTGKLDLVVQKLTELGVDEIVPLRTERSISKIDRDAKVDRLRSIAREAAKQSRRAWLPVVRDPITVEDAAADDEGATRGDGMAPREVTLVLHEEAAARMLGALPDEAPGRVTLVVGPEGGFSQKEIALLERRGFLVSLGPQILRTETAALVAAALILGHYGRIG
jgi:16S rRNA (uracil1498-N3)-methyltransferase